jgi:hypothetical protein
MMHFWLLCATHEAVAHESNHASLFGVGDGTVVMWPLVWVILAIGIMSIAGLIWAGATGHFKGMQKIAERHLELED